MYAVTKRIEFCYGHRLLEHAGACRHLHGHNAVAEVEVQSAALDAMNMVIDFGEITDRLEGWVLQEIDHRMLLHEDDPIVPVLRAQGEPMYLLDSNPTAERLARLLFDVGREQGLAVSRVTVWETSSSWATYRD